MSDNNGTIAEDASDLDDADGIDLSCLGDILFPSGVFCLLASHLAVSVRYSGDTD